MNILVTGGAGFIRCHLVRLLVTTTEHSVLNVDALTYAGNRHSLDDLEQNPRYRFAQADICDATAMGKLFAEFQPDWVMHLAAESHVDRSIDGPGAFIQTNVVGTFNLLQAARGHFEKLTGAAKDRFRFLHVSTAARRHRPLHRGDALRPALALLRQQGLVRPPRPRLGRHIQAARPRDELLEQLRSLPVPRKTHPRRHPQGPARRPDPCLRQR